MATKAKLPENKPETDQNDENFTHQENDYQPTDQKDNEEREYEQENHNEQNDNNDFEIESLDLDLNDDSGSDSRDDLDPEPANENFDQANVNFENDDDENNNGYDANDDYDNIDPDECLEEGGDFDDEQLDDMNNECGDDCESQMNFQMDPEDENLLEQYGLGQGFEEEFEKVLESVEQEDEVYELDQEDEYTNNFLDDGDFDNFEPEDLQKLNEYFPDHFSDQYDANDDYDNDNYDYNNGNNDSMEAGMEACYYGNNDDAYGDPNQQSEFREIDDDYTPNACLDGILEQEHGNYNDYDDQNNNGYDNNCMDGDCGMDDQNMMDEQDQYEQQQMEYEQQQQDQMNEMYNGYDDGAGYNNY